MPDIIEKIRGAAVQHGSGSDRAYLMKIGDADPLKVIPSLETLAVRRGYSKIFVKIPAGCAEYFLRAGYRREAFVPRFYCGEEGAVFLGRYLVPERGEDKNAGELEAVLDLALSKRNAGLGRTLPVGHSVRICDEGDVEEMASIYRTVFPTYPFPVHDPGYLLETMRSHVIYFAVESRAGLLALSSAELDRTGRNAEMTDFATLPESLGNGYAGILLSSMEVEAAGRGIVTAYTIARAVSPGMNITFARLGYEYGGRLVNNTQISGAIESMNVWYKRLS